MSNLFSLERHLCKFLYTAPIRSGPRTKLNDHLKQVLKTIQVNCMKFGDVITLLGSLVLPTAFSTESPFP